MSNKLQILRTFTAGKPVPGGVYPVGTPWINFADLDFGIIDAGQNPQSLLGVTIYRGTANYVIGDIVFNAGNLYKAKKAVAGVVGGVFKATDWDEIGSGGVAVTVAAVPPATPKKGDLWYDDTKDGRMYVWDNTQWVDAAPASNLGISAFDRTKTYALNDQVIQSGKLYVAKGAVPAGTFQSTQWDVMQPGGKVTKGPYANNGAAKTAGLSIQDMYYTATGDVKVVI